MAGVDRDVDVEPPGRGSVLGAVDGDVVADDDAELAVLLGAAAVVGPVDVDADDDALDGSVLGDDEREPGAVDVEDDDVEGAVLAVRCGASRLAEIGRIRKYSTNTATNTTDSTSVDGRAVTCAAYQARKFCGIRRHPAQPRRRRRARP